jgi:hypothetical protein
MRKNYILHALFCLLLSFSGYSQVSVGNGVAEGQSQPVEPWYEYSYSQTIYNANLINASGQITGIKYFATPTTTLENTGTWDIYMAHTDLNEHPQNEDGAYSFVDGSELTLVFSGPVEVVDQTVTITLDTPFDYNGTQNLIVAGHDTMDTGSYDLSSDDFYATLYDGNSRVALVYYNDVTPPDPLAPPTPSDALLRYANLVFEGISQQCPNPTDISVSNILGTSADFTWSSGENVAGFEYAVLPAGEEFESGTTTTENSVSISGLDPLTNYVFYIRSLCDGENSGAVTYGFATGCADLFELPFSESFENDSENEICWTIIDLSPESAPNNSSWNTNVSNAFEGSQAAYLYTYANQGKNDDYLISPRFNLSGNDRIKFAAKSFGNDETNNSMAVLMSTTTSNPEDFTITLSETTEYSGDWTLVNIDLSAYTGPAFIAFHVPSTDTEGYAMYVDAIVVEEMPDCDIPINISVSNESLDSANVVWSAGFSEETEWEYVVQLAELDPPTGQGTVVENTELVLDGLQSASDYTFYVRAVCSEGVYSPYTSTGGDFSTVSLGDNCAAPIQIDALPYNIADDTANYSNNYSGIPGDGCADTIYGYLGGNDVVYSYTAASDTSITVSMSPENTYAGIFAYDSCENIGVECYAAALNGSSTDNLSFEMNVSAEMTYYLVVSTWPSPYTTGYDLTITENSCVTPTIVTSNVDCSDGSYSVEFDLSDMGSAELLTFTDDLGNVQYAQETGILTFGPYESSSSPVVTVVGEDPNCDLTFTLSGTCNDECTGATPVSVGESITGDTTNATNSGNNASNDLWYSFTGNGVQEDITVSLCGSSYDTYLRIFDSCTGEQIYFNDDMGTLCESSGLNSQIIFTSDGTTTYYIMVEGYSNNNGAFTMNISGTLGISDVDLLNLRIYPNPVDGNTVTILSSVSGDKFVEVFDINGRKVISTKIFNDDLDVSNLVSGFYTTRVTIAGKTSVSKLIVK